ncbi:probable 28S ribosomal protein S26, mitochondrial [Eurytemora carolleeae]|uniref:probable 28S ribosomal protein S26, mitochondrial n=1 Tax=Eurytemora carolleeae TaxID=1294199 RepID=UPI000C76B740|nr:probable 28S ribosomal protein S26, mitochondrial [Eurytemora carolleeae]|eukprot:XP_023342829.1 probable 28S ribosomal protein S26, mitochondrial [Eurytemora affinis]
MQNCRELLKPTVLFLRQNPVRFKKFGRAIIPHKKPRWIPMARSKMFKEPPVFLIPQTEIKQEEFLNLEYNRRMNALIKYLDEDYQKFSDTGEAGRIEAELEMKEHVKLLQENDEENRRIAELRRLRLEQEQIEIKQQIEQELSQAEHEEMLRLEKAEEIVTKEADLINRRIMPERLEEAILEALDSPVDHEFAIDIHGHIYRGRETYSLKVPLEKREKLTLRGEQKKNESEEMRASMEN